MSKRRKVSHEELQKVQNLIEQCISHYKNKKQVMEILQQQKNIDPTFTKLVWERLEEENKEFFEAYYLRLTLKDQITQFNDLLHKQVSVLNQVNNNPHRIVFNEPYIPASQFLSGEGNPAVNHNSVPYYVPENAVVKAENMQQHINPAVVTNGFGDYGPILPSEMQPANMVMDRVAVGVPGYLDNSRYYYQSGYGGGMESHRVVSSYGNGIMDSVPVQHQLNGPGTDEYRSDQILRQFRQQQPTVDFSYPSVSNTQRLGMSRFGPYVNGGGM